MPQDIRDRSYIDHADVVALNFVRNPCAYVFRRHFRQGLRSHIMEILRPADLEMEKTGVLREGVQWFPKASPHKIFRIFRARLKTLDNALEEIGRVKIVERYLAPEYLAKSEEFVVDYEGPLGRDLMLCGFQAYVEGHILDPWGILDSADLGETMYASLGRASDPEGSKKALWLQNVRRQAKAFIGRIKRMILEEEHVPDLAGVGNLVMVRAGIIKLVDMNNISRAVSDAEIRLDDRGYPVCDKSIEALSLLERNLLGRPVDMDEPIYSHFLDPQRLKAVQALEEIFYNKIKSTPRS